MSNKQLFVTDITDVSDSTSAHIDTLGDIRWVGNKCYKYVAFDNGSAVAAVSGNACGYVADTGYAANTVTSDNSASYNGGGAGVFVSVPADGQYCWIQIKGPVTLNQDPDTGADGAGLTYHANATDGMFDRCTDPGSGGAGANSMAQLGVIQDDSAKLVSLDCPY